MREDKDAQDDADRIKIGTLREALKDGAWSAKDPRLSREDLDKLSHLPELDIPNLSLNKGIRSRGKFWFYSVAVLGVMLQVGSICYAAITVFLFPSSFEKDGSPVSSYAFPLYMIGSVLLFMGMLACAIIIQRSSEQIYFKSNKPSKIFWLQPGKQNVGDQVFNEFMAVKEGPKGTMTKNMEYIKSVRVRESDRRHLETYITVLSAMLGFVFQFVGLRGLHASVILAQMGSIFVMSLLRSCLRTERVPLNENSIRDDRECISYKHQELDCFAFRLHGFESFEISTPGSFTRSSVDERSTASLKQIIRSRTRLAQMTSLQNHGLVVGWDKMPIRDAAKSLAKAIESTMDLFSAWGFKFDKPWDFSIPMKYQRPSMLSLSQNFGLHHFELSRYGDAQRWSINVDELEAVLGLSVWSLYKAEDEDIQQPLYRLLGLTADQASQKETFRLFHKWIFRQTEARLVSAKAVDSTRRLFGWDNLASDALGEDILVVQTKTDVEKMVAQDIFIHFLLSALTKVDKLGGETTLSEFDGSYGSVTVQNTRIDDMVRCFEGHDLGSREDALLCVVLVLEKRALLPEFAADSLNVRDQVEKFIGRNDWESAFDRIRWLCQRSDGLDLEMSAYELGNLCRRALLDQSKSAQEKGLQEICRMLDSNTETDFFDTRKLTPPTRWAVSPASRAWWTKLGRQIGWVAWQVSIHAKGMQWIQPALLSRRTADDLTLAFESVMNTGATSHAPDTIFRDWLIMHPDEFIHQHSSDEDVLAFKYALMKGYHGVIFSTLLRLMELDLAYPGFIRHAFIVAARSQCDWAIQVLLRRGADINALNDRKISALTESIILEDSDAIRMLLNHGADCNGDRTPDVRPLLLAAQQGSIEMVQLLVLGYKANLESEDSVGMTALHRATHKDHVDTVRILLSEGAEINHMTHDGITPLLSAVMNNQLQMAEVLLQSGADINVRGGGFGQTALAIAVTYRDRDIFDLLMSKGADPWMRDDFGRTALDLARDSGRDDIVATLCSLPRPTQGV
ncbi:Uncharacterized protein PECH_000049 [Penicillium ucsense]|uniref:Uncharacterized protein n=1 Tax=Penicillium ucsense TaxID=2839758 RepID=A0A8J8WHC9_9EURO|nr:Uncharacterized protein PECM_008667 [Penicillium ucsense]KAF7739536.1 Uncharacterized protein PECH_000049 [Penicillium ucsense]